MLLKLSLALRHTKENKFKVAHFITEILKIFSKFSNKLNNFLKFCDTPGNLWRHTSVLCHIVEKPCFKCKLYKNRYKLIWKNFQKYELPKIWNFIILKLCDFQSSPLKLSPFSTPKISTNSLKPLSVGFLIACSVWHSSKIIQLNIYHPKSKALSS